MLDGGDSIHGTPETLFTEGAVITPLLNALGIQAAAPGNWEYGYGWDALKARIGESNYPWLAANAAVEGENPFESGRIFEVGDHRVGIVGLSSDLVGKTMSRKLAPDVTFENPVATLNEEAGRLRSEGAEVIVALSHLGLPQEWAVAEEVEGVDVILGAHPRPPGASGLRRRRPSHRTGRLPRQLPRQAGAGGGRERRVHRRIRVDRGRREDSR